MIYSEGVSLAQQNTGDSQPAITSKLRNEPVQARSTARLTRLLDAAAEVIDEIGFERLTTAMVAERAGASIGTVYRYFPDRIAVLQSLSVRATAVFIDEVTATLRNESHSDWLQAMDAALELLHEAFRNKSGFRSLRFGDVIDLRTDEGSTTNSAVVADAIAGALASRFELKAANLAFTIEVAMTMADALLARSFAAGSANTEFSAAAKSVARGYLIEELGAPD
ncbi:TetR/AcrR family transcriptional regulator [Homoserinimonas sp. A447]